MLRTVHAWMLSHQDLRPESSGQTRIAAGPVIRDVATAIVDANSRISGAQVTPRSESDIRINFNNTHQIIAASNGVIARAQAQFFSTDGGTTWQQTALPMIRPDVIHSDPTVDWTSDGAHGRSRWALVSIPPGFRQT